MSVLWKAERLMSDNVVHVGTFCADDVVWTPAGNRRDPAPAHAPISRAHGVLTALLRWCSLK